MEKLNNVSVKALPPIHVVCANDELRPVMNYVFITKEHVVASDAHIIAIHIADELFSEEFIDGFPVDEFLIHFEYWKQMSSNTVDFVCWNKGFIEVHHKKSNKPPIIIKITENSVAKGPGIFPNWQGVMPQGDEFISISEIGISAIKLNTLSKALGDPSGLRLSFFGANKGIRVSQLDNCNFLKAYGLIIPMMIEF